VAATAPRPKLVAIVGPTASGKSVLALRLAKEFDGEIIAADSRTIYIGMDIGTAKPTKQEQMVVKHWGIDLVKPGESFSAYKFKKYAQKTISDIQNRGKLPILVGGTGLYIDAVLFDFGFSPPPDTEERKKLELLSTDELLRLVRQKGYQMPKNSQNRRHLIRTIERKGELGNSKTLRKDVVLIGVKPDDSTLQEAINNRVERWFKTGLVEEVTELLNTYGDDWLGSAGIGYKSVTEYIRAAITKKESIGTFKKEHWQYARRQKTWFSRNKFIQWHANPEEAFTSVAKLLNK
jgi:tRNA dimethylallyltransferase